MSPACSVSEAYIDQANRLFDRDGKLSNESTRKFLQDFMAAFADWIDNNANNSRCAVRAAAADGAGV